MSFDLQSVWDSDTGDNIKIPDNLGKLKPANLPLDAIRKNMRNELWVQALSVVLIGFFPRILQLLPIFNTSFYCLYALMVVVSVYYLVKLYLFYKRISHFDNNTKDGLYEMYYDIRLTIETYRTFAFSLIPFVLIILLMFFIGADQEQFIKILQDKAIANKLSLKAILIFFSMFGSILAATELWIQYFYLKHARAIKKVLDELKEE